MQDLKEDHFSEFVSFIETLENVVRWTATLEESLHATESGCLHVHCFLEFSGTGLGDPAADDVAWGDAELFALQGLLCVVLEAWHALRAHQQS